MVVEQTLRAHSDAAAADWSEDVWKHVQANVVKPFDEGFAADLHELRVEAGGWTEQWRRVRADAHVIEAQFPHFERGRVHARRDRSKDIWIVAIERRVAGDVGLLSDLNGLSDGAVPPNSVADELRVPGDVPRSRLVHAGRDRASGR